MRWLCCWLAIACLACRSSFALQPSSPGALPTGSMSGMFPFALPPFDDSPSATDVSFLNDGAAGQWGFVRAQGENFVDGRGEKLRLWGVNLNFNGAFPSKTDAPHIAGRLAKFGFNAVRLHHFEGNAAPNGLWQPSRAGSNTPKWPLTPDTEQFDRLDFFVSELIKRGIYVDFNLHVARKTTESDGLPMAAQLPEKDKGIAYFEPQLVAKNKEFIRLLLTHINPYTKRAYKDEPGVCAMEVENENSILAMWLDGSLSKLPPVYAEHLRLKWNDWLRDKYLSETRLRRAWTEVDMPLSSVDLLVPPAPPLPTPTPTLAPIVPVAATTGDVTAPTPTPTPVSQLPVVATAQTAVNMPAIVASPLALQGWSLNTAGGGTGRLDRDELGGPAPNGIVHPGLSARMDKAGTVTWAFQMVRDGLTLDSGRPYTFSFWARSDAPRTISLNLWEDQKPFRWMGVTQTVKLTSDWQSFTIAFRPVGTTPGHARLAFNLTNAVGMVQMGDFSLVAGGRIGTPETWTLRNGVPLIDAKGEPIFAARRDFARFLGALESDYQTQMRTFLKTDLGVKVPIWHTQAQFGGWGGVVRELNSDAVDVHIYWKHPDISAGGWSGPVWRIENISMAANPLNDPLAIYTLLRPPGKPFVVTEWNSGQPNDFGSESLLMAAAYAAHQDWAGVWIFDYHSAGVFDRNKFENYFSIDTHPTKMATAPAAALLFRRSDVSSATTTSTLAFTPDKAWDEVANTPSLPTMGPFQKSWLNAGATKGLALQGRTAVLNAASAFAAPSVASLDVPTQFVSDTGEIVRDAVLGHWTVNTPRAKVWVGDWGGSRFQLGEVEAWFNPGDSFHAGSLVSLDGSDLGRSKSMLLTLAGRAENLNMGWNAARDTVGAQWGDGPTRVRVPQGTFKVCCDDPSLKVWALAERGQRRAEVPSAWDDGILKFAVSPDDKTLWYEIGRDAAQG